MPPAACTRSTAIRTSRNCSSTRSTCTRRSSGSPASPAACTSPAASCSPARASALDWLKMAKARGRYLGMELEMISVDEAAKLFPLHGQEAFRRRACTIPIEGHVDPYGVTHAYAKSAQIGGAEIVRQTRVTDLEAARRTAAGTSITEQGNVHAEHVVNAGRSLGARGRPHGRSRAAHPRDGASIPDHRRHAGARGQEGAAALHRLRGRDLHPRRSAAACSWAPTSAPACPGRRR